MDVRLSQNHLGDYWYCTPFVRKVRLFRGRYSYCVEYSHTNSHLCAGKQMQYHSALRILYDTSKWFIIP